jgi:hypothetical protein
MRRSSAFTGGYCQKGHAVSTKNVSDSFGNTRPNLNDLSQLENAGAS